MDNTDKLVMTRINITNKFKYYYEFRNVQYAAYERYVKISFDDINEVAGCNIRLFWKQHKHSTSTSKVYNIFHS